MNRKMIFHTVGLILEIEAALMLLPALTSLIYREGECLAFFLSAAAVFAVGLALTLFCKPENTVIYAREGFVTVALAWILMSAAGAIPFVISREIPSFVDAFFETVSGFTTTGASVLDNVGALSHGALFWRSFTHWVGGMGVLVFVMAIFPSDSGRSIHIMRAEMPGPIVGKIVPKIRETAKILYLIYIVLTGVEVIFLLAGGMPLFDSLLHAFGTAGTGGFGIKADSVAGYSPYLQWVIAVFMLIFGINFNLFYLILIGRLGQAVKSRELWCYGGIVLSAAVMIGFNIYPIYKNISDCARLSVFQVASVITTTGYSTCDFNTWPEFSKAVLLLLMFIGGCAGSTAGGLKVSRVILLFRMIKRDIRRMLHPRSVGVIKFEGSRIDDATLNSVSVYFSVYCLTFAVIFLLISLEPFDFETAFSATSACFNNIGPGLGAAGPMSSFNVFSAPSKVLLSVAMLLGRLEIFPIFLAFSPSTWLKN